MSLWLFSAVQREEAWQASVGRMRLLGATLLLRELRTAGMAVRLDGERVMVSPGGSLSEAQGKMIREWKPELVALLRSEPKTGEEVA